MVEVEERVFFSNRAYASLLGFRDPEQIIDRHISGLVAENDLVIGALCVVDFKAREWDADDIANMHDLAAIVEHEIESRAAASGDAHSA